VIACNSSHRLLINTPIRFVVDDATGTPKRIPLSADITQRLQAVNLSPVAPSRGANVKSGPEALAGEDIIASAAASYPKIAQIAACRPFAREPGCCAIVN